MAQIGFLGLVFWLLALWGQKLLKLASGHIFSKPQTRNDINLTLEFYFVLTYRSTGP